MIRSRLERQATLKRRVDTVMIWLLCGLLAWSALSTDHMVVWHTVERVTEQPAPELVLHTPDEADGEREGLPETDGSTGAGYAAAIERGRERGVEEPADDDTAEPTK